MAAAAPVYNRSWLTGRACPSGVYEWAVSECPASQTSVASTNCFFQQANRRLFSLQTVRGGPSQSELFGGIVAAAWGLSRTGLTGTRCPIVFNRGMSRRRWCQRVSSGPCGRSSPTMSRFQRISRNSWSSRWTAREKKGRRGNAPGPGTWWDAQLFVRPRPAGPTLVGPLNLVGPRWRDTAASRFAGGLLPKVSVCNCPHPSSSGPTAKVSESSIGSLEGRRSVCFAQPPGVVTMVKGNKIFNISRSLCPESGPILHTGGPRCAIPNLS